MVRRGSSPPIYECEDKNVSGLHIWDQPTQRIGDHIEKVFESCKRSYGLLKMRWRGHANAAVQIHLTKNSYNIKHCFKIVTLAGQCIAAPSTPKRGTSNVPSREMSLESRQTGARN